MNIRRVRNLLELILREYPAAGQSHCIFGSIFMRRREIMTDIYPLIISSHSSLFDNKHSKQSISLFQDHTYDLRAISWPKGSYSDIHGHAPGGCVFTVLHGELAEKQYDHDLQFVGSTLHQKGSLGYSDNAIGYHQISNAGIAAALSLHLYSNQEPLLGLPVSDNH